jgi:hypothetical protein
MFCPYTAGGAKRSDAADGANCAIQVKGWRRAAPYDKLATTPSSVQRRQDCFSREPVKSRLANTGAHHEFDAAAGGLLVDFHSLNQTLLG